MAGRINFRDGNKIASSGSSGFYQLVNGVWSQFGVSGGAGHTHTGSGAYSFIGGGSSNEANGYYSSVINGSGNSANGINSFIGAGYFNEVFSTHGTFVEDALGNFVGAGYDNYISGEGNFLGVALTCRIIGVDSAIICGPSNNITGSSCFIAGASDNNISGENNSILGGHNHTIYSYFSSIIGGGQNSISGNGVYSIAGGRKASVTHSGAAVLADGQDRTHASKGTNTMSLDYASGVYAPKIICSGAVFDNVLSESTTSRTLAFTDEGKYIRCSNAGAITITVPTQATASWNSGAEIYFRRVSGAGVITVTGAGGVTINNAAGSTGVPVHGNFALKNVATNTWDFI